MSSARRSSAWRHRNAAASAMSPGSSRSRSVPGSMWSRPVAGARWAAQTSAASPTDHRARRRSGAPRSSPRSSSAAPSNRARSAASRSGRRAAARPSRSRIAAGAAGREQELRRGQQDGLVDRRRSSAGRSGRRRAANRSRRRRTRSGSGSGPRRREDVDDAAAPRELAAAGHLGHRHVAEVEQVAQQRVLVEPGARPKPPRGRRQVLGGDRVLEERLDAGDEHAGPAAPPRGERGDPGRGLVGDELAALVGERRPRFEDGDGRRRRPATPRAPRRRGRRSPRRARSRRAAPRWRLREGGREVRLGTVRDRDEAGVPADAPASSAPVRPESLPERSAKVPVAARSGGSAERSGQPVAGPSVARVGPWRRRRRAASPVRPARPRRAPRRPRWSSISPRRRRCRNRPRPRRRRRRGVPRSRPRPARRCGGPGRAGRASAACVDSGIGVAPCRRTVRQPVFVRRIPCVVRRAIDLAGRGEPRSASAGRSSNVLNRLAALLVPSRAQASTASAAASSSSSRRCCSSGANLRQDVVDGVAVRARRCRPAGG